MFDGFNVGSFSLSKFLVDWDPVVLKKKSTKPKSGNADANLAQAKRSGQQIEQTKKYNAGGNKQSGGPSVDARKLEDPDSEVKLTTVSTELKLQISKARQAKGWTQKELAQKINEKPTVVADYEAGRGVVDVKVVALVVSHCY